jgi:signal transduction histidine kinase
LSHKLVTEQINRGRSNAAARDALLARITATPDYSALKGCDLVIEAVFEDRKVKAEAIKSVARISHDLAKRTEAELASEHGLAEIQTLASHVADVLRWSKDLQAVVDRRLALPLQESVERYLASRRRVYDASLTADVPRCAVRFPEKQWFAVLDVLVENAVRAAKGASLTIRITGETRPGSRVIVRVADDGPGIANELAPRIFDAGVSGPAGGTGFGLYAAQRTLERFGGCITLDREVTTGACFVIELDEVALAWAGSSGLGEAGKARHVEVPERANAVNPREGVERA